MNTSDLILVGVSGGVDSLCLLHGLNQLGCRLMVAHLNHKLRPESEAEAQTVEDVAQRLGQHFIFGEQAVPEYAQVHHLSIEEAAREVRYRFLFQQAEIHHAQAVAVAHNADDQVETVLMHLLRGTGLDGLTGMAYRALPNPWSDSIPLIRPMLGIWRDAIETYSQTYGLKPVLDLSNLDTTLFRNRLRHELIPELENYIPGFRARLWQTAELLSADRVLLDDWTNNSWASAIVETGAGYVSFNLTTFNHQPPGLQRRLIRKAASELRPGARDVDFAMIQQALDFSEHPTASRQADLGLGLKIALEGDRLTLSGWQVELPTDRWPQITAHTILPVPGELDLGHGWFIRAEIASNVEDARIEAEKNRDPYRAWIDLGDWQAPLKVRSRLPGDRFQPLGMEGRSTKLSDFMINLKIPRPARDAWPLVQVGDEIIWLPGYRQADPFRMTQETRQVVCLSLKRKQS